MPFNPFPWDLEAASGESKKPPNPRSDAFMLTCTLSSLALAEMRLILARIIWDFDLTLNQNSKDWLDNMETYILWQKNPLHVHFMPRTAH